MNAAVIVAGGNGTRMKMNENESKQFIKLDGVPVLIRTLHAFSVINAIDKIVVVTRRCDIEEVNRLISLHSIKKTEAVIEGGKTRQQSVLCGVELLIHNFKDIKNILIHDGARPFISQECILSVIKALDTNKAAAAGVQVKDTIKQVDESGFIEKTLQRNKLISIQTPQGFEAKLIYSVHKEAAKRGIQATDDCALVELLTDTQVKVTKGDYNNIKITTPEDIALGESILKSFC